MGFQISREGLDGEKRLNLDSLGKLYIAIATVWTIIIAAGAAFLLRNRDLPTLRVRNTHLWTSAVAFLHAYWVLCLLAYVMNGVYPCSAEFWIMSLWLPFGIALYQINGMHLLHISSIQSRFVHPHALNAYCGTQNRSENWWSHKNMHLPSSLSPRQKRLLVVGITFQVTISLVIYFSSKRFHSSWGLFGQGVGPGECRRGWEWLPSIAWQFFWSWVYAPYLLWRVRKIHDLHGWRLQTMICSLAGLLGSPMWLLSLYSSRFSPSLAKLSRYWGPPLWFTPGIVAMEVSVIVIPCIVVIQSHRLKKETRQHLAEWERNKEVGTSISTGSTIVASIEGKGPASTNASVESRRSELYSMKALEKALTTNITPLLKFSALKDFSGENISFLKYVQDWKANWTAYTQLQSRHNLRKNANRTPDLDGIRRHQFSVALEIYLIFIDPSHSDFPINISGPQMKDLQAIFESALSSLENERQENAATPFDIPQFPNPPAAEDVENYGDTRPGIAISHGNLSQSSTTTTKAADSFWQDYFGPSTTGSALQLPSLLELAPRLQAPDVVPLSFGPQVFDDVERAVKYAVLTNTWPKFVGEGLESRRSSETGGRKGEGGFVELETWGTGSQSQDYDTREDGRKLWGRISSWRWRRR